MKSARLPGKVLLPLGGLPVLELVLRRLLRSSSLDAIVLATSVAESCDPLVSVSARVGVPVVRGSDEDVLSRFLQASEENPAENIVRVCADRPFIAPEEVDRLVSRHLESDADYSYNHLPLETGYPLGLGAEVITSTALRRIGDQSVNPDQREHVTLYVWDNAERFRITPVSAPPSIAAPEVKLDLDTADDYERLKTIAESLDVSVLLASARQIVDTYWRTVPSIRDDGN